MPFKRPSAAGRHRKVKSMGVWIDPQTRKAVQDTSRVFEVDVDEDRLPEIRSLLGRACLSFVQQCIRVEILGRVEYIEGDPDDEPL